MGDSPSEFDEIELERAYDREELADVFREFAGALAADRPLRIDDGERTATITVPERVVAEFEAEREPDDPPVAELELELEWDDPDGSTLRIAESEGDEPGVSSEGSGEGGDKSGEASDGEPTDSAATMPPEAVTGGDQSPEGGEASPADESNPAAAEGGGAGADGRTSRFEVYEDRAGEWRWRLVHWNGNIVADSGEGYTSRSNARRAARSVMRSAPTAALTDRDD